METQFHLALPCLDLEETRAFYQDLLKAGAGRKSETWLDINLYGHQITFALAGNFNFQFKNYRLQDYVLPSFHFGLIVSRSFWQELYDRLSAMDIEITTEATFLENEVGEHLSFFIQDPNGYMVEFKCFRKEGDVFKTA
ncbi:MAG: VOC family protein [Eudoraea sp.]|nr:VOC family protein [Eudoraea sp.]MBT8223509.1 VOC family protein [Eudoraea sp.]